MQTFLHTPVPSAAYRKTIRQFELRAAEVSFYDTAAGELPSAGTGLHGLHMHAC